MHALPARLPRTCDLPRTSAIPADPNPPAPFWPRIVRAVALLSAAVAAHVWFVRAPRPDKPEVTMVAAAAQTVTNAPAIPVRTAVNVDRPAVSSTGAIQLRVDVVRALPAAALEGSNRWTKAVETDVPVSTTGIIAPARAIATTGDVPALEPAAFEPAPTVQTAALKNTPLPYASETSSTAAAIVRTPPPPRTDAIAYLSRPTPRMPAVQVPDPNVDLQKQQQVVLQILREYTRAFERMDVQAAKAVWPSLDDRALQHAYEQLDGQRLHLASCGVSISGVDANARCRGNATYRPKIGSRVVHVTEREWTFNLSRGEDGWQIVNARIQ
jgi:hypothetical protein